MWPSGAVGMTSGGGVAGWMVRATQGVPRAAAVAACGMVSDGGGWVWRDGAAVAVGAVDVAGDGSDGAGALAGGLWREPVGAGLDEGNGWYPGGAVQPEMMMVRATMTVRWGGIKAPRGASMSRRPNGVEMSRPASQG